MEEVDFKDFINHNQNKNYFFIAELLGLFHDLGKMSRNFLEEATSENQQYTDKAHTDQSLFDKDFVETVSKFVDNLIKDEQNGIISKGSFFEMIFNHHNDKLDEIAKLNPIANLLFGPGVDGIDSGMDKATVKDPQELKNLEAIRFYGKSRFEIQIETIDQHRLELQNKIKDIIKNNNYSFKEKIAQIRNIYLKDTEITVAESRMPSNDVMLSDHCYSVASLAKSLMVKNLYLMLQGVNKDELFDCIFIKSRASWQLFAITWDFDTFIKNFRRVRDVFGRQYVIEEYKKKVEDLISNEYGIANKIYDDSESIVFLFPGFEIDFIKDKMGFIFEELSTLFSNTKNSVAGESYLKILALNKPTPNLTVLSDFLNKSKRRKTYKEIYKNHFVDLIDARIRSNIASHGSFVLCDVCKTNIAIEDNKEEEQDKICKNCQSIRYCFKDDQYKNQMYFLDQEELGKVAIIGIKMPLELWLSGKGLKNIINIDKEIKQDVKEPLNKAFLDFKEIVKHYNLSNLMEYWNKRNEFNYDGNIININKLKDSGINLSKKTLNYKINSNNNNYNYNDLDIIAYILEEAFIQNLEELSDYDNIQDIIKGFNLKHASPSRLRNIWHSCREFLEKIEYSFTKGEKYRVLIKNPKELILLIPHDKTMSFIGETLKHYQEEFYLVKRTFPIFIVAGLFQSKYPLYIAVEAIKNAFDYTRFTNVLVDGSIIKQTESSKKDNKYAKYYLRFLNKDGELEAIDKINDNEQYYSFQSFIDFIILDSPERRHDTQLYKDMPFERYSNLLGGYRKTIDLDDFDKFNSLMNLFSYLNTSSLYHAMYILEENHKLWKNYQKQEEAFWESFVKDTQINIFGKEYEEFSFFAKNKTIFDIFDLWKYITGQEEKDE
ncbi:MAG: hypothetical protein ACP5QF_06955 [Desulfurella sp.]|uniref:hypothetical protein n=1 Tax=Desulfurella sp. TaxID=1962857 RepID=UPI003D0BB7F2